MKLLTCAWVNRTRRFRLWVRGNCIGFESETLHAASPDMFDICPIDPPADPPINLVTVNKNENNVMCYQHFLNHRIAFYHPSRYKGPQQFLWLHNTLSMFEVVFVARHIWIITRTVIRINLHKQISKFPNIYLALKFSFPPPFVCLSSTNCSPDKIIEIEVNLNIFAINSTI